MPARTVRFSAYVAPSNIAGRCGCGPAVATPWTARSTSALTSAPGRGTTTNADVTNPGVASIVAATSGDGASRTYPSLMPSTRSNSGMSSPGAPSRGQARDPQFVTERQAVAGGDDGGHLQREYPVAAGFAAARSSQPKVPTSSSIWQVPPSRKSRDSRIRCRRASVPQRPG